MKRPDLVIIVQGQHAISSAPETVISTVLGSCIAACLHDPVAGLGGMNHFMLPDGDHDTRRAIKYGLHAMEVLINGLIRAGAARNRLQAKLFGGARLMSGLPDIGRANADFATTFLRAEGIGCLATSLGGARGRKVRFWPVSGRAQMQYLSAQQVTEPVAPKLPAPAEIELF